MQSLLENLRAFNSKERYFLVGQILGNHTFTPAASFRAELGKALGLEIPRQVFSAIDYHIDWLFAALTLSASNGGKVHANAEGLVKAQQEDIDFLIGYDAEPHVHLILIEAKGVTGWTNKQMLSKARRLGGIFGEDGKKWAGVLPHFVLMSPRRPMLLDTTAWPRWMAPDGDPVWLPLEMPGGLKGVSRCDAQGHKSAEGCYWRVAHRPGRGR
jgi:hypothetical protein